MRKKLLALSVIIVLISAIAGYWVFRQIFKHNTAFTGVSKVVFIDQSMEVDALTAILEADSIIQNTHSFEITCTIKRFSKFTKPGRYEIKRGASNQQIVNMFRIGNQSPVKVRFGAEKSLEQLAGKLGKILRPDSIEFLMAIRNLTADPELALNEDILACIFFANTYEEFWTITPEEFIGKMKKNYITFWNDDRKKMAQLQNLDPIKTYILASIVKGETVKMEEAPKIAGLYLNRLKNGTRLQADPTAVFGAGGDGVQRVTGQIAIDSRYNTYLIDGLPPGPIAFVGKEFLEAVLQPQSHDYIFMCAKPDFSGYHNFSISYSQHQQYAAEYHRALNARGIK